MTDRTPARASERAVIGLQALAQRHGLDASATDRLARLLALLAEPEAPTAVHDPRKALDVHLADSLAALDLDAVRAARLIADVGAGAGLPGLPLAAALADARVVLVESTARKCAFLRRAIDALGLGNAEVACARVEEWEEGRGRCDVVCARAVAALPVLCEYAAPLLRADGILVAWKGEVDPQEAAAGRDAAAHLGLRVEPVRDVAPYPGSERRTFHVFRRVGPTPPGFPRRPGMAAKRPLGIRRPSR